MKRALFLMLFHIASFMAKTIVVIVASLFLTYKSIARDGKISIELLEMCKFSFWHEIFKGVAFDGIVFAKRRIVGGVKPETMPPYTWWDDEDLCLYCLFEEDAVLMLLSTGGRLVQRKGYFRWLLGN